MASAMALRQHAALRGPGRAPTNAAMHAPLSVTSRAAVPAAMQAMPPATTRTAKVAPPMLQQRQQQVSPPPSVQGTHDSADVERRKEWMAFLRHHRLLHVADPLLRDGFDDLETLAEMEDSDVQALPGISPHDAARLRSAIQGLRGVNSEVDNDHPVVVFLREHSLQQYADILLQNGFDDMETLAEIQDSDMRDLGLLRGHALRLARCLRELQQETPTTPSLRGPAPPACTVQPLPARRGPPASRSTSAARCYERGPQASEAQMGAVERSWDRVQKLGSDVIGEKLYKHVFRMAPQTMGLFPREVRYKYRQWSADEGYEDEDDVQESPALRKLFGKVVNAIGVSVAGLRQPHQMVPLLTQLGARHISYGVDESYWGVLGEGLILTLQECLGDEFTQEVQLAWTMVYGFISAVMIQGLKQSIAARDKALAVARGELQDSQTSHVDDRSSVRSLRSVHSEHSTRQDADDESPERAC
uniref:Globin domain-containing protein n=1 Tax=Alexandrium catenella TaxID=2925 RepID=A0A7S1WST5_ALECA|mmetsp:Transcript_86665/g.230247  ORF Transcript_86665/g.230247 Transcript_86665/m.230247 type:complete len:474 (+) Transcript_86665:72-1493(+)